MKLFNGAVVIVAMIFLSQGSLAKAKYTKRKPVKVSSISCEKAYKTAKESPSKMDAVEATDTCEKAAQSICTSMIESEYGGEMTGDARYMAAACELSIAYGANKAVNQGVASKECEKAVRAGNDSPSTGDVGGAVDVCRAETDKACEAMVNSSSDGPGTGDGRLVSANCSLIAARGPFQEVKKEFGKSSTASKSSNTKSSSSAKGAK